MATRRVLAAALSIVAVLAFVGEIVAPKHYVHLMPYQRTGVFVTVPVVASLLLGVAVWLTFRRRIVRGIATAIAVLLAAGLCVDGWHFAAMSTALGVDPQSTTVLGVAPGGRFELVKLHYSSIGSEADILRVRSRQGLRSREAAQDLACFVIPFDDDAAPDHVLKAARFLDDTDVEVTTADGTAWRTTFDPRTLLAAQTLSHC